jgi:cytoskeletal protein CcmA (bactofilin family)
MLFTRNLIKIFPVLFFLLVIFSVIPVTEAAMVVTGDSMTIGPGETIDDDLYMFGDVITISGMVTGDAIIFGREVIIDGTVMGSVLTFAQNINITGDVAGTIRGAANNIYFRGSTGRDLMMAANMVSIEGEVGSDYFVAANRSVITGSVGRHIRAALATLVIDGPVGGNVYAVVENLTLRPGAVVGGEINYTSENEAAVSDQAVTGPINRQDPPRERTVLPPARRAWSFIRPVLSLLAVALLMAALFPGATGKTARNIRERPGLSIGFGALVVFLTPLAALLVLFTVIGIPISFLSMLLYIVLIYLSRVFAGYFLADLVFDRFGWKLHPIWTTLAGVFVLALLIRIPYIGWALHLTAVLFGTGAFILYLSGRKEKEPSLQEEIAAGEE